MRQQLKYLQAELCSRGGGSVDEVQVLIVFLTEIYILVYHEMKLV